ncbi:glycosyltransferase [Sphingobium yanoikuyae]|uniref:glycosyltransferase n=1 Tax=Sphingobium yanoikuyae TaxID=13690 RepID=UPI0022DE2987|nr:glycosyltransferase [Sphingobium yanoikuyae]WBQ16667.1 glycosyltransferase [Sphingobium yanoikuyae]
MNRDAAKRLAPAPVRKLVSKLNRAQGRYKSAGVPVTGAVHGFISRGNAARSAKDWEQAAEHYRAAVSEAPNLAHIWIQLGHMLKQKGDVDQALDAYARAETIDPDGEGAVEQGRVAKLQKKNAVATQHFLRAYRTNNGNIEALTELLHLLERRTKMDRQALASLLKNPEMTTADSAPSSMRDGELTMLDSLLGRVKELNLEEGQVEALRAARERLNERVGDDSAPAAWEGDQIVFDASDLIEYFAHNRLPTGIQRVQIATITDSIRSRPAGSVKVCCFLPDDGSWIEVATAKFIAICGLALISGDRSDPQWQQAYTDLKISISLAPPLKFNAGAFLVNLGTSWWLRDYFLFVREAKRLHGVRYIPFVHDLIPIVTPQYCVKALTQEFIEWALGVFQHADFFLVNSNATKNDLLKVASTLGHHIEPEDVAVIPLDAQFRDPGQPLAPVRLLRDWQLKPDDFVLMVSTIEVRKNHAAAFDAWEALIEKHGARQVPKLVCVGKDGWLNDAIYARLDASSQLRSRVVILSGLSDEELGLLYDSCRFTLYPSHYEGWGLPATESLCYGKVPLLADNSSLPEAGGPFGVYFQSGSLADLIDKAERLVFDRAELQRLEAKIAAEFSPRTWQHVADQIGREIETFLARKPAMLGANDEWSQRIEPVTFGAYYPLGRTPEHRIWKGLGSAEIYRSGTGWYWPEEWGCWTKGDGGELALRFLDQKGPVRGFIKVHAPPGEATKFEVSAPAAGVFVEGSLQPDEFRWIAIDIADIAAPEGFHIRFKTSRPVDLDEVTGGADSRVISLGVGGFYFCHADDLVARANFIEAMTIGGLRQLAFNREPAVF